MAVSFVSQTYKPNDYILPVDLQLLGRVNQYKQTQFYNNAANLKQMLGKIKHTDIANEHQRQRLLEGYNQVVNRIREAGPLDFSDMSVVASIEGLGAQIYDDPAIISGISDTRRIRKLQAYREKVKTDPKLAKYQNAALEWWDNEYINDYISGDINARYRGNDTPTLSLGKTSELVRKGLEKVKPDVGVSISPSGDPYFYSKETNSLITGERLQALLETNLDADLLHQMKIEGAFRNRDLTPEKIGEEITLRHNATVRDVKSNIERLTELIASEPNTDKVDVYKTQLSEQENYIETITANYNRKMRDLPEAMTTREGRAGVLGSLYIEDQFKNTITAFAHKQIKQDLIFNRGYYAEQMFKAKREIASARAKKESEDGVTNSPLGDPDNPAVDLVPSTEDYDSKKGRLLSADNIDGLLYAAEDSRVGVISNYYLNNIGEDGKQALENLGSMFRMTGTPGLEGDDFRAYAKKQKLNEVSTRFFNNVADAFDQAAKGDYSKFAEYGLNVNEAAAMIKDVRTADVEVAWLDKHRTTARRNAVNTWYDEQIKKGNKNVKSLTSDDYAILLYAYENRDKYFDKKGSLLPKSSGKVKKEEVVNVLDKAGLLKESDNRPFLEEKTFVRDYYYERPENYKKSYTVDGFGGFVKREKEYFEFSDNNDLLIPSNVYLNYKNIDRTHSQLQSHVADGFYPKGTTAKGEANINPTKNNAVASTVEITSITQLPFYSRTGENANRYARVNFSYKDGDEVKFGYKYLSRDELLSYGITPPSETDEKRHYLLQLTGELPKEPIVVQSWSDNPIVEYKLIKTDAGQIQAHIFIDGDKPIVLKKIYDNNTKNFKAITSSWEIEPYLQNLFRDTAPKMDRADFAKHLRSITLKY